MKAAKKKKHQTNKTKASIVYNCPNNKSICQLGATHSLCFRKGVGLPQEGRQALELSCCITDMWKTCKIHPLQLSWKYLVPLTYTPTFPCPYSTNRGQKIKMVINSLASIQGKNYMPSENKIRIVSKLVWCKLCHNSF